MDADAERIQRARAKNLAYIRQQDERKDSQTVDELLASAVGSPVASSTSSRQAMSSLGGPKGNTSAYITGLTTYMACRQFEGACAKIGKVRRIKFYKNERGGLKGDALVTFSSRATMKKAVDRLNHFEVKPGVIITATEATFSNKKVKKNEEDKESDGVSHTEASAPLKIGSADDTPPLDLPSCFVILKHIWGSLDSSNTAFIADLEEDIRAECARHGVVKHVQVVADGSVVVRFAELKAAIACQKVMNGRWFAGRQIEAQFDQASVDSFSDADTKVEAFLASLGE